MSSIILRGVSGFGTPTNQNSLGITYPVNLQPGDFMFAWCATNGSSAYSWSDTIDGFNALSVSYVNGDTNVQLLWKMATVNDCTTAAAGGSFTITMTGTVAPWTVVAGAYGGVNRDRPIDTILTTSGNVGSNTSPQAVGINTTAYNDQLLWFGASGSNVSVPTITPPATYTTRISQTNTSTGSGTQMCTLFADNTNVTPGWTGNPTGALNSSHGWGALLLALIPENPTQVFNFESGAQGFTGYQGTHVTVAQSTGWSRSGTHSVVATTDGTYATPLMTAGSYLIPLTNYLFTAWLMSPAGWALGAKLQVDIYTSANAGSYITTFAGPVIPLPAGVGIALPPLKFQAPAGSNWVHLVIAWQGSPSVSDMLYMDDVTFGPWTGQHPLPNRGLLV